MQENKAEDIIHKKYIGKKARITTRNKRTFDGKIMCIDYRANIILHEAIAEIPTAQNCPLNYQLNNYADYKLEYYPPSELPDEEQKQMSHEYTGSHYYFGSIMVTGKDILKIELENPKEEKENE